MDRTSLEDVRVGSRSVERYPVRALIEAIYCGETLPVLVRDLSTAGLRLESHAQALRAGDWLRVMLPIVGKRLCQVTWDNGEMVGAQLAEDLGLDDLVAVIGELREIAVAE